ncbi:MAG: LysE family translocator [Microbispora sp.]|nr:LysE family translocator [Microbispora sp.]
MLGTLLAFAVAVLLGSMVPGPTTAVLIRQTLRGGRRASVWTLAGNETGVFLWGLAVAFGLSGLIAASQLAYDVLRVVGAAVLLYLGAQALWENRRRKSESAPEPALAEAAESVPVPSAGNAWHNYRIGLLTIVTNPKYAVFAVSFLPQFVPSDVSPLPMFVLLSALWVILDSCWFLGFIWFIHWLRPVFSRSRVRAWLERTTGAVLIALGLKLVTEPF